MSAAFVDIAQSCAPMVQVETLAAVVSLESRFLPFNIRINSGMPLSALMLFNCVIYVSKIALRSCRTLLP